MADEHKKDKKDKKQKKDKKEKKPHHPKHGKHGEDLSAQIHDLILSAPAHDEHHDTGEEAWQCLLEGNALYTSGHFGGYLINIAHGINETRKNELKGGQHPHAIVVSCSDSRVPPELVFNQGLGHLFVVRVAGNVLDPVSLGSIEYAVEHLHTPLIVILGHQKCGAVKAAIDTHGSTEPDTTNIPFILQKIYPAVEKVKADGVAAENQLDEVVKQNVRNMKDYLLANSHVVKEHMEQSKVVVHTAEYSIDTGAVSVVN